MRSERVPTSFLAAELRAVGNDGSFFESLGDRPCDHLPPSPRQTAPTSQPLTGHAVVSGYGTVQGDLCFTVTITDPAYSAGEVRAKLLSGELYTYHGDTTLYDEDWDQAVGTIEWGCDRGDFVPHEIDIVTPKHNPKLANG